MRVVTRASDAALGQQSTASWRGNTTRPRRRFGRVRRRVEFTYYRQRLQDNIMYWPIAASAIGAGSLPVGGCALALNVCCVVLC